MHNAMYSCDENNENMKNSYPWYLALALINELIDGNWKGKVKTFKPEKGLPVHNYWSGKSWLTII